MDDDFGSEYIDYVTARDAEGGLHNGHGHHSSGTRKFMLWAFIIMMALFCLIGMIANYSG